MSGSETNGNIIGEYRGSSTATGSIEDLSEYTDADESISAPTEILAEFLSAIMLKDYETALKYCKLILHYEPNNLTAKEFYPLIAEKIEIMRAEKNEPDEDSSSDYSDSAPSSDSNHSLTSGEESESKATDSDATSASYSSLEDEEADRENNVRETGSTSLTSNDIFNGNTERPMDKNHVTSGAEKTNGNQELKRKLENIIGWKSMLSEENARFSSYSTKRTINNSKSLTLSPTLKRNSELNANEDEVKYRVTSSSSRCPPTKAYSQNSGAEVCDSINCSLFSSDSESPTDPTVHELKSKVVKSVGANK